MRFVLLMVLVGCAAEDDPPCLPPAAEIQRPTGGVVTPPLVDVRIRWIEGQGPRSGGPSLRDDLNNSYTSVVQIEPDGTYVHHYILPPNRTFDLRILGVDECQAYPDGLGTKFLTLDTQTFRTGM